MFALIIAIVSIALIVATVAATMYHGGDTLNQGRAKAEAAGLVAGGQQVAAAYLISKTLDATPAVSGFELVQKKHLASIPTVFSSDEGSTGNNYLIKPLFGVISDLNTSVSLETCQALDKLAGAAPAESQSDYPNGQAAEDYSRPYGCVADESMHFYFKI